jgi:hypothetical protein
MVGAEGAMLVAVGAQVGGGVMLITGDDGAIDAGAVDGAYVGAVDQLGMGVMLSVGAEGGIVLDGAVVGWYVGSSVNKSQLKKLLKENQHLT